MLNAMRTLALDYLYQEIEGSRLPDDLERWYRRLKTEAPLEIFSYLVESPERVKTVYVIEKDENEPWCRLSVLDMQPDLYKKLPFVRPTGPQAAQIGPVIKRNYTATGGASPKPKILRTTMSAFKRLSESGKPWSGYFAEINAILSSPGIILHDGNRIETHPRYDSVLECVFDKLGAEQKGTVFVTVRDHSGKLPGERPEYIDYLKTEVIAGDRYVTQSTAVQDHAVCPLCHAADVTVFPNALKGAGLNFTNVDREGAFPGITIVNAWKRYSLCTDCADLLYIYKNHVLKKSGPKQDRRAFAARVAGEQALLVPFTSTDVKARHKLVRDVKRFLDSLGDDVDEAENDILDVIKDEEAILTLTFVWSDIGQNIENIRGLITEVPPTRLRELSRDNETAKAWQHPIFSQQTRRFLNFNFHPDLSLTALSSLFFRPGGKKAKNANASQRLFQLKREIAGAVYHKTRIDERRFWEEVMTTARWHWQTAADNDDSYELLNEGNGKKGPFFTTAGWIRNLAWWLYYFAEQGVLVMHDSIFAPEMDELKPFFGPQSGINSEAKAFAFLLGALYGKLIEVQGAKGVNVGANALTWLRRLTLKGKDLPQLYVKIREKLLVYETEKSPKVRMLIGEIGKLGVRLGDAINLDEVATNYFLLLGQSMAKTILKKDHNKEDLQRD